MHCMVARTFCFTKCFSETAKSLPVCKAVPPTNFMHYVYLLKSRKDGDLYIGETSDLRKRLQQHNNGESKATKNRTPFELIYYEAYPNSLLAKQREKKLKNFGQSYYQLKKRIGL